jgi:hypothetical protein
MAQNNIRVSSHPIASALLWKATMDFYEQAQKHGDWLDIGGNLSFVSSNAGAHGCLLSNTSRDASRYLASINSKSVSSKVPDYGVKTTSRGTSAITSNDFRVKIFSLAVADNDTALSNKFCLGGAECCNSQAKFAVSIHSLYDATCQNIYDMFDRHGIEVLLAVMYMPQELRYGLRYSNVRFYENSFTFYEFHNHPRDPKKVIMGFKDCSFVYIHDREEWHKYFTTTLIIGRDFDITIEDYEQNGPEHRFRFVRVPKHKSCSLPRLIQPELLVNYVAFPDIHEYIRNGMISTIDQLPKFLVPADFHRKCLMQALKAVQLDNAAILTYINGITNRIDINTKE